MVLIILERIRRSLEVQATGGVDGKGLMEKSIRVLQELERQLSDPKLLNKVGGAAIKAIDKELKHQYDAGVDPYNEAWAELALSTISRGRTPPPLSDTEEMRRHSKAMTIGGIKGIRVKIDKPSKPDVPSFHQSGTENMPARKLVPDKGLPKTWELAVTVAASRVVIRHFKK